MAKDKLNVLSFGLAFGATVMLYILIVGIAGYYGWGTPLLELIASWYVGFAPTVPGIFIGAFWGFIDGFIGGIILSWLYNVFLALRR